MNTIKTVLLTIMMLITSVTAFASYSEEYEKNYPNRVTISKDAAGIELKYYDVYLKNNVGVSVCIDTKGNKYCALEYIYIGSKQKNYNAFKFGNGKKDYILNFYSEPIIVELGSEYIETYGADIDTKLLKKAVYIGALGKDNKVDYLIPPDSSDIKDFKEALKVAEKILSGL